MTRYIVCWLIGALPMLFCYGGAALILVFNDGPDPRVGRR